MQGAGRVQRSTARPAVAVTAPVRSPPQAAPSRWWGAVRLVIVTNAFISVIVATYVRVSDFMHVPVDTPLQFYLFQ